MKWIKDWWFRYGPSPFFEQLCFWIILTAMVFALSEVLL